MLALEGISVRIGPREVLSDISTQVRPGELTIAVGPNGAGKSSLMKVMTGERRPDGGRVTLRGRPLSQFSPPALARERAVLPQSSGLAFPFTVLEVVRLGLDGRAGLTAERRRRAPMAALERVELGGFGARRFQELSGGEQQRVHLARVLCQIGAPVEAGIARTLFLDEPTSSLDIRHQIAVLEIARDFARAGGAVFAILHDLNLAATFADRMLVMHAGRIAAEGAPAAVLAEGLLEAVFGIRLRVSQPAQAGVPFVLPQCLGADARPGLSARA
jgi:iron complex transport system ATP-binding protein